MADSRHNRLHDINEFQDKAVRQHKELESLIEKGVFQWQWFDNQVHLNALDYFVSKGFHAVSALNVLKYLHTPDWHQSNNSFEKDLSRMKSFSNLQLSTCLPPEDNTMRYLKLDEIEKLNPIQAQIILDKRNKIQCFLELNQEELISAHWLNDKKHYDALNLLHDALFYEHLSHVWLLLKSANSCNKVDEVIRFFKKDTNRLALLEYLNNHSGSLSWDTFENFMKEQAQIHAQASVGQQRYGLLPVPTQSSSDFNDNREYQQSNSPSYQG